MITLRPEHARSARNSRRAISKKAKEIALPCFLLRSREPQAIRSVIRIIATTLLTLDACSFVFLLQVQTKFFLAVNVFSSCSIRSSPSAMWQTMAFSIGGLMVFDPGCMMTSRSWTFLKPGMMAGVSLARRRGCRVSPLRVRRLEQSDGSECPR